MILDKEVGLSYLFLNVPLSQYGRSLSMTITINIGNIRYNPSFHGSITVTGFPNFSYTSPEFYHDASTKTFSTTYYFSESVESVTNINVTYDGDGSAYLRVTPTTFRTSDGGKVELIVSF